MLKLILSFLSGPLTKITNDLTNAYKAKLEAQNDKERIAADERISILEARKTAILSAQSDPVERFVRIGFASSYIIYLNKVIIWDKVLGWGTTDNLSPDLWNVFMIVLGGYFIDTIVKRFR